MGYSPKAETKNVFLRLYNSETGCPTCTGFFRQKRQCLLSRA
ncbi:hypothetical protein CSC02_0842 [Enterobacter hormaechei subsp. hoffmannii]|nr:hypothetical protein CSC02_0842 [Enterobacter hormaechei subsp. hoffmannii]